MRDDRLARLRGVAALMWERERATLADRAAMLAAAAGLTAQEAPPVTLAAKHPLQAAPVPTAIIHGWRDELIPATDVVAWAAPRGDRLLLVDDGHRLSGHVEASAALFADLLGSLAP